MFDVLVYVLEHCQQAEVAQDTQGVARKLHEAGFDESDISTALSWLAGAARDPRVGRTEIALPSLASRVLARREVDKLDAESHGFLLRLETCGILDPDSRERVLERIVAAPVDLLSLEQIKLVALMVLWQRGNASGPLVTEDVFFDSGAHVPN